MEEYNDRIGENDLNPTYKDGQVFQHVDINEIVSIVKTGVNENYHDIQKLQDGTKTVGDAKKLDGASISRYIDETLQANDNKVPSSQQVKAYLDEQLQNYTIPVRGVDYWTEEDKQEIIDETADEVNQIAEDAAEDFNTNATNKTNDFNTNASNKTSDYNSNATSKTTDFNDNASAKTTSFNNNATSKTGDYNDNAAAKIDDFNTYYNTYKAELKGDPGADGQDGAAATITIGTVSTGAAGTSASVTNSGTSSAAVLNFIIPQGAAGANGTNGTNGQDGQDGQDGADGQDGYSPTATVSKSGSIATISITDKNGTTTTTVVDGENAEVVLVNSPNYTIPDEGDPDNWFNRPAMGTSDNQKLISLALNFQALLAGSNTFVNKEVYLVTPNDNLARLTGVNFNVYDEYTDITYDTVFVFEESDTLPYQTVYYKIMCENISVGGYSWYISAVECNLFTDIVIPYITQIYPTQNTYKMSNISEYSSSSTYALGSYVYYENLIYKCTTAIPVAENWNTNHWTQKTYMEYLQDVLINTALGGSY